MVNNGVDNVPGQLIIAPGTCVVFENPCSRSGNLTAAPSHCS